MPDAGPPEPSDRDSAGLARSGRRTPRQPGRFAFDTEFVSEETFEPVLCLIQVATRERLAAVDPLAIRDFSPFWDVVTDPAVEVVMHAASEDLRICRFQTGTVPRRVYDVQIAAGLVGFGYPLSLGNLVSQALADHGRRAARRGPTGGAGRSDPGAAPLRARRRPPPARPGRPARRAARRNRPRRLGRGRVRRVRRGDPEPRRGGPLAAAARPAPAQPPRAGGRPAARRVAVRGGPAHEPAAPPAHARRPARRHRQAPAGQPPRPRSPPRLQPAPPPEQERRDPRGHRRGPGRPGRPAPRARRPPRRGAGPDRWS